MPHPSILIPFQLLGIPVTVETGQGWCHSTYYHRAAAQGIRAAIKLARSDGLVINERIARTIVPDKPSTAGRSFFQLDHLTAAERQALEELLQREEDGE